MALPVWLAMQEELLGYPEWEADSGSCFDHFDDAALFEMFHLTRPCITFITDAVQSRMKELPPPEVAPELPVDAMLMLALNSYAHGVTSTAVMERAGLSQMERAGEIITGVTEVIAGMCERFVSFPQTRRDKANVAAMIEHMCGMPDVLGIVATVHFKIRACPYDRGSYRPFINSLGHTTVVTQVICDSEGNILSVEECCVGGTSEQEIWEASDIGKEIDKERHGDFWVIGGRGYHFGKNILPPLVAPLTESENRFNEAHARILHVMLVTLGSIKRRFMCLMQLGFTQEATLDKKSKLIKTCCVLHNIAKKFSVPEPPATVKVEPLYPGKQLMVPAQVDAEVLQARRRVIENSFSLVPHAPLVEEDPMEEDIGTEEVEFTEDHQQT